MLKADAPARDVDRGPPPEELRATVKLAISVMLAGATENNCLAEYRDNIAALRWLAAELPGLLEDRARWDRVQNEGISVSPRDDGQFVAFERGSSIAYTEPDVRLAVDSITLVSVDAARARLSPDPGGTNG